MSTRRTDTPEGRGVAESGQQAGTFRQEFVAIFDTHFQQIFRYIDRSSGDPEMAADIAQEVFLRLYRRGSLPDTPAQWLVTVAMNLLRNEKSKGARRGRILTPDRARRAHSDRDRSPLAQAGAAEEKRTVRRALDQLPDRDRSLLLLRAEGYSYRDLAGALELAEASVGTLLARAKERFRRVYQEGLDAS